MLHTLSMVFIAAMLVLTTSRQTKPNLRQKNLGTFIFKKSCRWEKGSKPTPNKAMQDCLQNMSNITPTMNKNLTVKLKGDIVNFLQNFSNWNLEEVNLNLRKHTEKYPCFNDVPLTKNCPKLDSEKMCYLKISYKLAILYNYLELEEKDNKTHLFIVRDKIREIKDELRNIVCLLKRNIQHKVKNVTRLKSCFQKKCQTFNFPGVNNTQCKTCKRNVTYNVIRLLNETIFDLDQRLLCKLWGSGPN